MEVAARTVLSWEDLVDDRIFGLLMHGSDRAVRCVDFVFDIVSGSGA